LKAKPNKDPGRFTREEAKRTLDEVRKRYGILEPGSQAHQHVKTSSNARSKAAKQQPRPMVGLASSVPKEPSFPAEQARSAPPLNPVIPSGGCPSDKKTFQYLIRIAECALTLHCEVTADNDAAARNLVEQIPNLLEWREISN
jgi:hypothetical protein